MKPQIMSKKTPLPASNSADSELSLSFQNELVATIQGAFEVAVEIAVLQVTKLVDQAIGDVRDQMRETQRENESLKLRLLKAEERLQTVRYCMGEGDASKHRSQATVAPNPEDGHKSRKPLQERRDDEMKSINVQNVARVAEDGEQREQQNGTFSEISEDGRVFSQRYPNPASRHSVAHEDLAEESSESSGLTVTKTESLKHSCQSSPFELNDSPTLPSGIDDSAAGHVKIKEEKTTESGNGFDCMIEDDFSAESLSLAQSKMLEDWKPEMIDIHNHNADSLIPGTSLSLAHPPNMNPDIPELSIPSSSGLPSISSQFPSLFPPGEPAPIPGPPQVCGVQVWTGHSNPGHPSCSSGSSSTSNSIHNCKICGQGFHQPSLLRRHYGQCQQRVQQRFRPPTGGARRTKLQLYPPGCSPFRCTECNRDFNRLENLKTHLRIHTGERPYTCSVCSVRFRHSGALTRHFRIHTGEKPYVCGQCGKSFRNCGGLKFHQRSHNRR